MTEGGDKEKLEAFVNFCEDAIFEMQHASGLMAVDDGSSGGGKVRKAAYAYMDEDEEERWDIVFRKHHLVVYYHDKLILDLDWYAWVYLTKKESRFYDSQKQSNRVIMIPFFFICSILHIPDNIAVYLEMV